MEFIYPISKVVNFFSFFPLWIDYHFRDKYLVDDQYREIYVFDHAIKEVSTWTFERVRLKLNQHEIFSSAIFQAKFKDLENAIKQNREVEYLKSIKTNMFTLEIGKFYYSNQEFREKVSKMNEFTQERHYQFQIRSKFKHF